MDRDETSSNFAIWSWVNPRRARWVFKRSAVKSTLRPGFTFEVATTEGDLVDCEVTDAAPLAFDALLSSDRSALTCRFNPAISARCVDVVLRRDASSSRSSLRATRAISRLKESANEFIVRWYASVFTLDEYRSPDASTFLQCTDVKTLDLSRRLKQHKATDTQPTRLIHSSPKTLLKVRVQHRHPCPYCL